MKLGDSFSGALRTFAIFANVIELDDNGKVLNAKYAENRAVAYIHSYCEPSFKVEPPYEDWEIELY